MAKPARVLVRATGAHPTLKPYSGSKCKHLGCWMPAKFFLEGVRDRDGSTTSKAVCIEHKTVTRWFE